MKKATNTQQLAKAKTTAESNGKMTASQKLELLETVAQNQSRQIEIMAIS